MYSNLRKIISAGLLTSALLVYSGCTTTRQVALSSQYLINPVKEQQMLPKQDRMSIKEGVQAVAYFFDRGLVKIEFKTNSALSKLNSHLKLGEQERTDMPPHPDIFRRNVGQTYDSGQIYGFGVRYTF